MSSRLAESRAPLRSILLPRASQPMQDPRSSILLHSAIEWARSRRSNQDFRATIAVHARACTALSQELDDRFPKLQRLCSGEQARFLRHLIGLAAQGGWLESSQTESLGAKSVGRLTMPWETSLY